MIEESETFCGKNAVFFSTKGGPLALVFQNDPVIPCVWRYLDTLKALKQQVFGGWNTDPHKVFGRPGWEERYINQFASNEKGMGTTRLFRVYTGGWNATQFCGNFWWTITRIRIQNPYERTRILWKVRVCFQVAQLIWPNYSDLTRPKTPKWWWKVRDIPENFRENWEGWWNIIPFGQIDFFILKWVFCMLAFVGNLINKGDVWRNSKTTTWSPVVVEPHKDPWDAFVYLPIHEWLIFMVFM